MIAVAVFMSSSGPVLAFALQGSGGVEVDQKCVANAELESPAGETKEDKRAQGCSWFLQSENPSSERLWSQTRLLFGMGLVAVGILYVSPQKVSRWDRDIKINELPSRWWDNVSTGPVWDKDDPFLNYVAHPYCGGVFYQMSRKSGYSQWNSFLYSAVMSTFFWEYGIEAFAEQPSIQDLIVTPVAGWIYGEWAFRRDNAIRANGGEVFGSKILGGVSLFLLDPMDTIGTWVNSLTGREWVITGSVVMFDNPLPASGEDLGEMFEVNPSLTLGLERRF